MQKVIEGFQLSPQQRRLWLLQQQSQAFYAQCAILIEGQLNHDGLKHALHRVVRRHEILRTTFYRRPGIKIPIQVVSESILPSWREVAQGDGDCRETELDFEEVLKQERSLPCDFESGPLVHACMRRLAAQKHLLVITLPAVLGDARTLKQLFKELADTYQAVLHGAESSVEATQYLQFAEWQNELTEAEEAAAGKEFWRRQTADALPELKLPLERAPRGEARFEPDSLRLTIDEETVNGLALLARHSATTIDVVLLACWQTLLLRLTGQSEFIIDCLFDGRKFEELDEVYGLFACSLPIRASLEKEAPFTTVLQRALESTREAQAWQEYFASAKEAAEPRTHEAQKDLPVGFSYEERPARQDRAGASFTYYMQYCCLDPYRIRLNCFRQDDSLTAEFQFEPARFNSENVLRIARGFQVLLQSVGRDPHSSIAALEILDKTERQQLLSDFNQTAAAYPRDKCIHQLFEEQAARTPDAPAVICGERQLTYSALNARSNQLARFLREHKVGPTVVVGLCVERSLEMLVGLLGILKAGAGYVALDPHQPTDRLAFQLEQSRTPMIITEERLLERLPRFRRATILLDSDWRRIEQEPDIDLDCAATPHHLVYVIYTSGSTGVPKGVAITHRSLVNYASFICRKLRLDDFANTGGLHFATVSTLSADLGNTAIFPSLISGGCLHILSHDIATDGTRFADYFAKHPIDVLKIVPSHLGALLGAPEEGGLALPRRCLILGGEALSREMIERLSQRVSGFQILNHYGPTETTIGSLTYSIGENEALFSLSATVPIGRPIANTQIYVLDERLEPVPNAVTGELYIGGDGLAEGYLHQPEQTAERFLPHPFSKDAGARLYKTGDLVRYLPDGNVEFIGRADQQVKLRGFRIELGEIEAALGAHPSVRAAVATAREDEPGHKRLVAYLVLQPQTALSDNELRSFLKEKLPEYMVPQAFVTLKVLPLTPNGKVDRKALPKPEQIESERALVSPFTSVEKTLAEIWEGVLGVERIGIHDNFFERGGDSILSIQIITRANRAGLRLTPKQLFEHPTIAELATVAATHAPVEIEQGLVTGSLPLTPIQHWFFAQDLPEPYHWNMAALLEMRRHSSLPVLEKAFEKLLLHHDALRLRFVKTKEGWQQFNEDASQQVAISRVDLSNLSRMEQSKRIETVAGLLQASLNLSQGPLLRIALFDLGTARPALLLIIVHHLTMDGVSWRILLEDLATACGQLSHGEEMSLSPKTTSFKRWAELIADYAQSTELRSQLDYWMAQSSSGTPCLPVDFPGGADTEASTRNVTVSLSGDETRALLQEVPEAYHTQISDVLLTALMQAWAGWTGLTSLLVDLEGHGREELEEDIDLSRTIGWFTTHYPVRLSLRDPAKLKESLMTIKEQLRRIPQRGLGYGLLRYMTRDNEVATSLRAQAPPAVSFNYLGQFDQVLSEASPFSLAEESIGAFKSLGGSRSHPLRINGSVMRGQLQVAFAYSESMFRQHTIERLAREFISALRFLISHCLSGEAGGYTSSDFPEAGLRQEDLDKLLARFSQTNRS